MSDNIENKNTMQTLFTKLTAVIEYFPEGDLKSNATKKFFSHKFGLRNY